MLELITFGPKIMGSYGTLLVRRAVRHYPPRLHVLQITSVPAIVLMIPGAGLLLLLERFLKSEYLVFFGQL